MKYRRSLIFQINITPLIDVILVLLIIFMLAVSVKLYTMPVNLPPGHTNFPIKINNKSFVITITRAGSVFIDKQPVTILQFPNFLHVEKNSVFFIYADSLVRYGKVMTIMRILNQHGFYHISLVMRDEHNEL